MLKGVADLVTEMGQETYDFWVFLGNRLLKGEKDYGGFKFADYNLDLMSVEELGELMVYRVAKSYMEHLKAQKVLEIDE
jgi:hypothetical protein